MTNVRQLAVALAAAALLFSGVGAVHAQATGAKPAQTDPMATVRASMKARFGFTDAQSNKAIARVKAIQETYIPKMKAIQKKYGASPTPEQKQKMQAEGMPMMIEMGKKMQDAVLSVATPEQRAKIKAQMQSGQGGKPKG